MHENSEEDTGALRIILDYLERLMDLTCLRQLTVCCDCRDFCPGVRLHAPCERTMLLMGSRPLLCCR